MQPEHLTSVDPHIYPTTIADTGALSVSSGSKTGRTPKDKRVVLDETTKDVSFNLIDQSFVENMVGQRQYSYLPRWLCTQQTQSYRFLQH